MKENPGAIPSFIDLPKEQWFCPHALGRYPRAGEILPKNTFGCSWFLIPYSKSCRRSLEVSDKIFGQPGISWNILYIGHDCMMLTTMMMTMMTMMMMMMMMMIIIITMIIIMIMIMIMPVITIFIMIILKTSHDCQYNLHNESSVLVVTW